MKLSRLPARVPEPGPPPPPPSRQPSGSGGGVCTALTRNGSPCRVPAVRGSRFCALHDPAKAAAVRAGRVEGGKTRSKPAHIVGDSEADLPVKSAHDVVALLADTINRTRKGLLDPRVANALGYLASAVIRALEVGELEERLAALEAATRSPSRADSTMNWSHAQGDKP